MKQAKKWLTMMYLCLASNNIAMACEVPEGLNADFCDEKTKTAKMSLPMLEDGNRASDLIAKKQSIDNGRGELNHRLDEQMKNQCALNKNKKPSKLSPAC